MTNLITFSETYELADEVAPGSVFQGHIPEPVLEVGNSMSLLLKDVLEIDDSVNVQ